MPVSNSLKKGLGLTMQYLCDSWETVSVMNEQDWFTTYWPRTT